MKTVKLTTVPNETIAAMVQGVLKSCGIDSYVKNMMAGLMQSDIFVFEDEYQTAKEILAESFPEYA
jgi:hypothetical protein